MKKFVEETQSRLTLLYELVKADTIFPEQAAGKLNMTTDMFTDKLKKYKIIK